MIAPAVVVCWGEDRFGPLGARLQNPLEFYRSGVSADQEFS
jgi:hypothetical protein